MNDYRNIRERMRVNELQVKMMTKDALEKALNNPQTQMKMLYAQELEAKDKEIQRLRAALEAIRDCEFPALEACEIATRALEQREGR